MKDITLTRRNFLSLAAFSALGGALALSGCAAPKAESSASSSQASSSSASVASSSAASSVSSSAATVSSQGNLGKVLVAYYSASGNTRAVAEDIAAALGAETFDITPVQPYSSDDLNWTQAGSRVNVEHEDESKRDIPLVQVTPDGFAEYDTIILGYPIWWAIAAWPVDGFVSGNDFTGKTVIPFCTSTSSGLGSSAELLEELAGTGTWLPGQRFSSSPDASVVSEWALSL